VPLRIFQTVPVLKVCDVLRSMLWYETALGFESDPFPDAPPHSFAILRHGETEIMLQLEPGRVAIERKPYSWDVYLRLEGGQLRTLYEQFVSDGIVHRRLERMFYGLSEFEITDPDGHVLCLAEKLRNDRDLPKPEG
jgi:uncharacterized glyoxalase superfamily protein PhnB